LWRGAPLVDVEPGPLLSAETTRLEDTRLRLFTDWAEADLRLGRHRWRVGDLAGLSARHPTNERVQALYMLALLGSGRRDRALEVYQQLRRTLRCELDTEPTPACQLVHHLVLDAPPDSGDELHWQHRVLDELAAEAAGRQGVTGPAEPYPSSRPRLRARL
jgi:DNA-binding SARP family transcriptional activator